MTALLCVLNVRSTVAQYRRDQSRLRFFCFLGTLVIASSLIISVSYGVIDKAMDSEASLRDGMARKSPRA